MTDNRTLDEVKKDDIDQLEQAYRYSRQYRMPDMQKAARFTGACVQAAMMRLGVKVSRNMNERMVQRLMDVNGIKIEERKYPDAADAHRQGLYIYKIDGELAYFISAIVADKPSPFALNRKQTWNVSTNVPVNMGGTIRSMPGQVVTGGMKGGG